MHHVANKQKPFIRQTIAEDTKIFRKEGTTQQTFAIIASKFTKRYFNMRRDIHVYLHKLLRLL